MHGWVRGLALNTSVSNADAHAKNYSIVLSRDGIAIAPMYGVLTTTYWPDVDRRPPMEIGGARGARQLTPHHWRRLAENNGLDPDRVEETARNMAWLALEHADEAYRDLPVSIADGLRRQLESANEHIEPFDGNARYLGGEGRHRLQWHVRSEIFGTITGRMI